MTRPSARAAIALARIGLVFFVASPVVTTASGSRDCPSCSVLLRQLP